VTIPALLPDAQFDIVDGVPAFWAESSGPMHAALVFRVGFADEALPQHGVTHLLEHLALVGLGQQAYAFNAQVEETRTTFWCSGSPEQVSAHLAAVTAALASPPLERLAAEQRILRVEAEGRSRTTADLLRFWRYGAQGPALHGYDEFALRVHDPEVVRAWAARAFTKGNAALWITGTPPDDLRLHLPEGERLPQPSWADPGVPLPCHVTANTDGLAFSMLVPRAMASGALEFVLQRRLMQRLRYQDAVSYGVRTERRAVNDALNELFVFVDGLPESQPDVERGLLDVVAELRRSGAGDQDLADWRAGQLQTLGTPEALPGLLNQMVTDYLYSAPVRQSTNLRFEAEQVSAADVNSALEQGLTTAIYCVPRGSAVVATAIQPAPDWSTTAVTGNRFAPVSDQRGAAVVGQDGMSIVFDAERRVTINWAACAAALLWDDGSLELYGLDGVRIELLPHDWRDFAALRAAVVTRIPSAAVVQLGAPPAGRPAPSLPTSRFLGTSSSGALGTLAVLVALLALLSLVDWRAFLFLGLPLLAFAGFCAREVVLRRQGKRRSAPGLQAGSGFVSRPFRHAPRRLVWAALAGSTALTALSLAAAAAGVSTGPLPLLFGFTAVRAVGELSARPQAHKG
jgi:hypothetical protein